ncbi:MAG: hypothetical protein IJF90_12730, partial [Synergistaceae bacterium]|nr:hypothetical protein [Synergistaceae bacterium]
MEIEITSSVLKKYTTIYTGEILHSPNSNRKTKKTLRTYPSIACLMANLGFKDFQSRIEGEWQELSGGTSKGTGSSDSRSREYEISGLDAANPRCLSPS